MFRYCAGVCVAVIASGFLCDVRSICPREYIAMFFGVSATVQFSPFRWRLRCSVLARRYEMHTAITRGIRQLYRMR